MQDKETTIPLIHTKLYRPPLPVDLVVRPRLTPWLDQHRMLPLTLIVAPAGYGKSTLAKCWVESLDCLHAWVSLDEHDDNLVVFLSYFLAAIQMIEPNEGDKTLDLLKASPLPPQHVITASLINKLTQVGSSFVLVLDNFQHIHTPAIHELLDTLLLHPPRNLHLVIFTRSDPLLSLSRLRARGQMVEVRAQGLRFSRDEASALFRRMLGKDIDESTVDALEDNIAKNC